MKHTKKLLATIIMTSMILGAIPPVRAQFVTILALNPEQGPVGTTVDITGRTDPDIAIQICYSKTDNIRPTAPCSSDTILAETTSLASGSWSASVAIPASVAGRHPILAVQRDDPTTQATRAFEVIPQIRLNSALSASGAVDDPLQVTGRGFAGNSPIAINFDNVAMSCVALPVRRPPVSTDQFGSFSAECKVPESDFTIPDGRHEVEAVDTDRNVDPEINKFLLIPSVSITPTKGPVGVGVNTDEGTTLTPPDPAETLTVKARGFVKLARVTVCFERGNRPFENCRTGTTNALGSLPPFMFPMPQVPQKAGGAKYVFDANQTVSGIVLGPASIAPDVVVRPAEFAVVADLDLNPDHALAGEEVEATGTGFAASSGLTVTLRRLPTPAPGSRPCTGAEALLLSSASARTLSTGSFFLNFSTPGSRQVDPGLYQILATDGTNEACADFAIGAFFRVKPNTPSEGKVGDTVTVQGFGFTRREGTVVSLKMVSTEAAPATRSCGEISTRFETDRNGDFEGTFMVPNCNRGDFRITATDENRLSSSFMLYTVFPWVDITPKMGVKDDTVTVTLTGFARNAAVRVQYFGVDSRTGSSERLPDRVPQGFFDGATGQVWNGTIPNDLSDFTGAELGPADLVDLWQIETVGRLETVRTVSVGSLGNVVTTFPVPESWGGFHPVLAREDVSGVVCGPDGDGSVVNTAVTCAQPFRVLPTVKVTPSDPKAGEERMTLEGSGYAWWDHYSRQVLDPQTGDIVTQTTNKVYRLAFDVGRIERYIDEARHIMNGVRDPSWDFGAYLPVALNERGTIVYWDYRLEDASGTVPASGLLGQIGSPFLKAPGLQPGGYDVVAYRLILASLPSADKSEQAKTSITVKSAEKDAIDATRTDLQNARTDIIGRVGQAQEALLARIGEAQTAIADMVTQARDAIVTRIGDAQTAVVNRIGEAQTAIVTRVADAQTAIVNRVGEAQTAVVNRVAQAQDAVVTRVGDAQTALANRVGEAQTAAVNRVAQAQDAITSSVGTRATQSSVDAIGNTANTVKQDTSELRAAVPLTLQASPLGYVIAILAAIAALGSIAAAIVTSRRLKVAG